MNTEPMYKYVKGQGWVPYLGPPVYAISECGKYYVVDLADIVLGIPRSFAPWHPEYTNTAHNYTFQSAIDAAISGGLNRSSSDYTRYAYPRKQHICAILASDYDLLCK